MSTDYTIKGRRPTLEALTKKLKTRNIEVVYNDGDYVTRDANGHYCHLVVLEHKDAYRVSGFTRWGGNNPNVLISAMVDLGYHIQGEHGDEYFM